MSGTLSWNATLFEGDLADSISRLKAQHEGNLIISGAGELARDLASHQLIDEFWFTVSPCLWSAGPRIFDQLGSIALELIGTRTFSGGIVQLCYRPGQADMHHGRW